MEFAKRKKAALDKVDLSKKGSVDDLICDLIDFINKRPEYFTTSSCSGRIVLLADCPLSPSELSRPIKKNCKWFLTSHRAVSSADVVAALKDVTMASKIKLEPFIVHVQCSNIQTAQIMLKAGITSGFRNSGITMNKHCKNVMVAIRGTLCLEVPLTDCEGRQLTTEEYVEHVVAIANAKMAENEDKIKKFENNLRNLMDIQARVKKVECRTVNGDKKLIGKSGSVKKNDNCVDIDEVPNLDSLFIA